MDLAGDKRDIDAKFRKKGPIMSFLKKLFGGSSAGETPAAADPVEHQGYTISPAPAAEGGQFRLGAVISKEIDGEVKEHRLIRADLFPSRDEAIGAAVRKAKLVIAEQGDRMFS